MLDIDLLVREIDDELRVPRSTIAYLLKISNGLLSDWLSCRRPMPSDKIAELRKVLEQLAEIADFCHPFKVDWRDTLLVSGWLLLWAENGDKWKESKKLTSGL